MKPAGEQGIRHCPLPGRIFLLFCVAHDLVVCRYIPFCLKLLLVKVCQGITECFTVHIHQYHASVQTVLLVPLPVFLGQLVRIGQIFGRTVV